MRKEQEDYIELEDLVDGMLDVIGHPETLKLPQLQQVEDYILYGQRRIWLEEQVDNGVLEVERRIFLWNLADRELLAEDRKPIWMYIFNYGGSSDAEQSLIDVMDASITPIYTVNLGVCLSAAAEIFTAGKKRFMLPNARTMYHQGFVATQGDVQKVNTQMADYNRQLEKTKHFLLERTKIPPELYEQHKYDDWWLDADECIRYGVCDHIIRSLDEVM